jgi:GntR family transcriptional regulator
VGTAVPSVRELARELRVNPATVSKAYQRLTAEGALEVRRGEGTFVAARPAEAVAAERERLLAEGAERFAETARSMGVSESDARAAVSTAWSRGGADDDGEET